MKTSGFWGAVFLVMGTMIGVGLLAMPVVAGLAGFFPGMVLTAAVAVLMLVSGYALAERVMDLRSNNGDLTSLYATDLGDWTRWVVLPVYMLMFYAVLVAYLAAAAGELHELFEIQLTKRHWILVVFAVASCFMLFGQKAMLRLNGVVVISLFAVFFVLIAASAGSIRPVNLTHRDWRVTPFLMPVICCSFTYHNIVPFVCRKLEFRRHSVHLALASGLGMALFMTLVWFFVTVGSLPLSGESSLTESFLHGIPATAPLAHIANSTLVTTTGLIFALLAILTSYIGVGTSLSSFFRDIFPALRSEKAGGALFALVFGPPLALALFRPDIFLDMVDLIGGVGTIVLFGLLPAAAFVRHRTRKATAKRFLMILLFLFFLFVLFVELGKVLHLISIKDYVL